MHPGSAPRAPRAARSTGPRAARRCPALATSPSMLEGGPSTQDPGDHWLGERSSVRRVLGARAEERAAHGLAEDVLRAAGALALLLELELLLHVGDGEPGALLDAPDGPFLLDLARGARI